MANEEPTLSRTPQLLSTRISLMVYMFVPSIEDELRLRVVNSGRANEPLIDRATVILTSFQCAVDDREDMQSQYYTEYINWELKKDEEDDGREERRTAASRERMLDKPDYENFGPAFASIQQHQRVGQFVDVIGRARQCGLE